MGLFLGFLNAITTSFLDVFFKRLPAWSPLELTLIRMVAAAPVLAMLVTIFAKWFIPTPPFWLITVALLLPLEIFLAYLSTRAVQIGALSIIAPIGAFTSIFLVPVGYLVLGELPAKLGLLGVLLIVIGSFFLGWRIGEVKLARGLGSVFSEPGTYLGLLGAFISSITITVAKFSFRYAPPLLAAFYLTLLMTLVLVILALRKSLRGAKARSWDLTGLAAISGASIAIHYTGLSIVPAVYFISLKRLSILIRVIWGKLFFSEEHAGERFLGAALMVAGVVLIAIG